MTRVGIISFSDAAIVNIHLDEYYDERDLLYQIDFIKQLRGGTNMAAALRTMREEVS